MLHADGREASPRGFQRLEAAQELGDGLMSDGVGREALAVAGEFSEEIHQRLVRPEESSFFPSLEGLIEGGAPRSESPVEEDLEACAQLSGPRREPR